MMKLSLPRSNRLTLLVVNYFLWAAVSLRWVLEFIEQGHPLTRLLSALLLAYGLLLGLESLLPQKRPARTHAYLALQTGLVLGAMLLYFELDFFAMLFLPLAGQATLSLPRLTARRWVGVLIAATLGGQIVQFGWPEALPFSFLYIAGILFITLVSENSLQVEAAGRRSEALLEELQEAHQQLTEYAGQAEELAVAQERNRLARELHDSVAQTLYGLTLRSAAALHKLNHGDTESVAAYLEEFQESTQQSLRETRLLIHELRPEILDREGLHGALIARLESVERRSGLELALDISPLDDLPRPVEAAFYGIAQEALNNILRHARASQVEVILRQTDQAYQLRIRDDGVGFDARAGAPPGGLGVQGMQERADQIGAALQITGSPGQGVCVSLEAPR